MDIANGDAFDQVSKRLERLAQLKEQVVLEDAAYQEIKKLLLGEMNRCAKTLEPKTLEQDKTREHREIYSIPYGQLHSQIVEQIASAYKSEGGTQKQRIFRAMAEMAGKQALYPGDTTLLTELV